MKKIKGNMWRISMNQMVTSEHPHNAHTNTSAQFKVLCRHWWLKNYSADASEVKFSLTTKTLQKLQKTTQTDVSNATCTIKSKRKNQNAETKSTKM